MHDLLALAIEHRSAKRYDDARRLFAELYADKLDETWT